jgi:hypothetical protein
MAQDNLGGDLSLVDFITLKEAMVVTRSNYLHLLADRDYILTVSGVYQGTLEGKEHEVDRLTRELVNTQDSLESTQMVLQKSKLRVEQLQKELSQASLSSISVDIQSYTSAFSQEVFSDILELMEEPHVMGEHEGHSYLQVIVGRYDTKIFEGAPVLHEPPPLVISLIAHDETIEHTLMDCGDRYISGEDTSIWDPGLVDIHDEETSIHDPGSVDIHGLINKVVHPRYRMILKDIGVCSGIQGHTMMSSGM